MSKCSRCGTDAQLCEGPSLCFDCSETIEAARKQTARAKVALRKPQSMGTDVLLITYERF